VVVHVVANRGLTDPAAVRAFLDRASGDDDPFKLAGMHEAVARLRQAVEARQKVVVYGDFDADGVTATAVLMETLGALGADVESFIPHRERDGYGLHRQVLERLARDGTQLVVTVDCGIRATEEVAAASRAGIDVIVTDHHALAADLPDAVAVINPRRPDCHYVCDHLAGVGLAYKLAQALLRVGARMAGGRSTDLSEEGLLDLVALGTVADLAPLVGENRSLVHRGLAVLRQARRPGIRALSDVAQLDPDSITARSVAYVLAPRLNAAGRMADADAALALLLARDEAAAWKRAQELEACNVARRAATDRALRTAEASLAGREEAPFLLYSDPEVGLGVTGLVAGRLAERFGRPVAVARIDGGRARGSARSIPAFNMVSALAEVSDLLVRFGGHAQAAGFTVRTEDLPVLESRLSALAEAAARGHDLRPVLEIDTEVSLADLSWPLFEALESLTPFGEGNPRPILLVRGVRVADVRQVGRGHLKFEVEGGPGIGSLDAIAFGQGNRLASLAASRRADIVFSLRDNEWQGRHNLQLQVEDLAAPSP